MHVQFFKMQLADKKHCLHTDGERLVPEGIPSQVDSTSVLT